MTDIAELDILGNIAGVEDFEALFSRSVSTKIDNVDVRIASIDDLLAMKRAANRPKDQNHILELEALKRLKSPERNVNQP